MFWFSLWPLSDSELSELKCEFSELELSVLELSGSEISGLVLFGRTFLSLELKGLELSDLLFSDSLFSDFLQCVQQFWSGSGMRRGFGKSKTGGWGVLGGDPPGEMAPHFRERS